MFLRRAHSADRFVDRGHLYGSDDDVERFAFFSKAALEFLLRSGKRPEIIHCHDWQTALVPVLLYEIYQPLGMGEQRVCFTAQHLELQFCPALAHLVYAGSDLLVMPSTFESCGLAQSIALKYGTVPIVRAVGGLADTIADRDHAWDPPDQRTGYVFHHSDHQALESAMARAIGLWYDYPQDFRYLVLNGMRTDRSWARPGQDYLNIYDHIKHK